MSENHPIIAAGMDIGHAVAEFFGIDAVDNFVANRVDGQNSPTEIIQDAAIVGVSAVKGEKVKGEGSMAKPKGAANPKVAAAIKAGKQAHAQFSMKAAEKGWDVTPRGLTDPQTGLVVIPDAVTPSGHPVELKPNTPTGRVKGEKQLQGQQRATGSNGKVIYYDPLKFMNQ
jgi:hypothetical protein